MRISLKITFSIYWFIVRIFYWDFIFCGLGILLLGNLFNWGNCRISKRNPTHVPVWKLGNVDELESTSYPTNLSYQRCSSSGLFSLIGLILVIYSSCLPLSSTAIDYIRWHGHIVTPFLLAFFLERFSSSNSVPQWKRLVFLTLLFSLG